MELAIIGGMILPNRTCWIGGLTLEELLEEVVRGGVILMFISLVFLGGVWLYDEIKAGRKG